MALPLVWLSHFPPVGGLVRMEWAGRVAAVLAVAPEAIKADPAAVTVRVAAQVVATWEEWAAVAAQAAECKYETQLRLGFLLSGGTAAARRL
ncbi:hypothetical protein AA0228_2504 [Gluconobacter frateurii NRIC 0228]|uniref:Uncharacterized protein n=1 Tax=Gluconobacter frateurii NRIC 0228 TaxID=1307946 RepID=A0ABQ0QE98_9PROT|nr:hypothetical protein AA0228_2504 [Gluconobacter frateurii NRIC 0228]